MDAIKHLLKMRYLSYVCET